MIHLKNLRQFSTRVNTTMSMNIIDKIGIVEINNPNSSVNVINSKFSEDLWKILDVYYSDKLDGIIFKSGKKNNYIAGADIEMLKNSSKDEIEEILDNGHKILNQLSSINSVAAINGSCLGGGLEFALACRYRVASDSNSTILGLPEVKLGLLPGMGGTQLFPKLVGLKSSLPKILTGSSINSKNALKMGLVDYSVDEALLDKTSMHIIKNNTKFKTKHHFTDNLTKSFILSLAEKDLIKKTNNLYPAPIQILDIIKKTYKRKLDYNYEKQSFVKLLESDESKSLINIFENSNKIKDKYKNYNQSIKNVSIIGSGLMGTGIAKSSINNLDVKLHDTNIKNLNKSIKTVHNYIDTNVKKKKITPYESEKIKLGLNSVINYDNCDVIIEAVSEDLDVKEKVFKELDSNINNNTILATNTSSLSVNEISKFVKNPNRFIGMHYFSPVEKMPLLEIIRCDDTDEETLSKAISVGKKQNKTMIVVKDVPGFYVNRCLTPYMNEALHLLCEGFTPSHVDKIMTNKGFPVGPFTLMDEVGLDICSKVNEMLKNDLEGRITDTNFDVTQFLMENNNLGKKTGKGFYDYSGKRKKDNQMLLTKIEKSNNKTYQLSISENEIFERLLYKFINESIHCLNNNIIVDKIDGDIGAIYGTGFPPYLGGPFTYIEKIGEDVFYDKLDQLNKRYDNRYNFVN